MRCSLQGLFITPEEMFELKSGLEAVLAALQPGGTSLSPGVLSCRVAVPPAHASLPMVVVPTFPSSGGFGWTLQRIGVGAASSCLLSHARTHWGVLPLVWGDGGSEGDPAGTTIPMWSAGMEHAGATGRCHEQGLGATVTLKA